jgi:hypothetical protein
MSNAEEKKWLKQLGTKQKTYLYRLNKEQEEGATEDEKPW